MDRINLKTINEIYKCFGEVEIGSSNSGLTLRFGYWKKLSEENVERVNYILPNHLHIVENLVDEDEDCGELWNYNIVRKNC
jgi:hypothetical protein